MAFRRSKSKKASSGSGVNKIFERDACDERLAQTLSGKFKGVSKVASLIPYLLEDDRIACQYADPESPTGFKFLTGGYFRFYKADEGMIYLSAFKRPMQLALLTTFNKPMAYHKWAVGLINFLYIRESTEKRVASLKSAVTALRPGSTATQVRSPAQAAADAAQRASLARSVSDYSLVRAAPPDFTFHVRNAPPGYTPGR